MPITCDDYKRILRSRVSPFTEHWLNGRQEEAAFSPVSQPLFIVAGPGTGKTTVLAIRILYLIFVEGFTPESILATTFTRKAANELRSRILSWGYVVRAAIMEEYSTEESVQTWINTIDINLILTGTVDAIAQEAIENDRLPTEITPVVIEKQLANGFIRKNILFQSGLYTNVELKQAIADIKGVVLREITVPEMIKSLGEISDRFIHDLVDVDTLGRSSSQNRILVETVRGYWSFLNQNNLMDFAVMEREFLQRIQQGRLPTVRHLRAVFVDEFQDTNPLQEEIYYALCEQLGTSLTVVGDDDQSIFRFRGATVEIFSRFQERIILRLGRAWEAVRVDLIKNYRSTAKIVDFSNAYIHIDSDFITARTPNKQMIEPLTRSDGGYDSNVPILGMFRGTVEELATDLTSFLCNIFVSGNHQINIGKEGTANYTQLHIIRGRNGDWGDAVLLSNTANDFTSSGRERLPRFLRHELVSREVSVFNPRGRSITDIEEVRICLGLILLCIDNDGHILESVFPLDGWARVAVAEMRRWRSDADAFVDDVDTPERDALAQFVNGWATQTSSDNQQWPSEWPLVELLFTLMRWIPMFQNDPEGQIYLELLARTMTIAGKLSKFSSNILFDRRYHEASVSDIMREVMLPIANGEVDVDEDIMPNVPRSFFPIMTIHQAKGLEFPLVIVDVGSDYKINSSKQRFSRYPENGGLVHHIEDYLSPYSRIGQLRLQRSELQRAFDDLRRLYFVADTRAQNILLLVGLNAAIANNNIKIIQSGYSSQDNRCHLQYKPCEEWIGTETDDTIMLI